MRTNNSGKSQRERERDQPPMRIPVRIAAASRCITACDLESFRCPHKCDKCCGRGSHAQVPGGLTQSAVQGRLKGGKGQLYEGGVRMPGAAVWLG